ncbi:MAG: tRNA (N(6)-L-threonylcarbamoyladenosine(37)-C(2))-methylthiotransferase MtaB [Alphaproteobacteria bacterium]|nr:tRNA (N(6)-L-threonylcarbamoyladenosine(37)-C(2))-methylthiotransferase MtaB [Alphaproteobacteria bacterium]
MSGPEIVTFGCRLNTYESEVIRTLAHGQDDTVVVNTCAVTAEAERQARQTIRKLRRERPEARIIVTGCAAQIDPARFAAMPEVDRVVGNAEKMEARSYAREGEARVSVADIMTVKESAGHLLDGFGARTRAFVEVQNGCDHRCTFCIIPYGRGPSRSVPMGRIAEQVRLLAASGVREVVLTGVDLTSYGTDLPGAPSLGQMVRRLLATVPELERLRLSSLDMVEIDEELVRLIVEEKRIAPHLHLSLQAGDDLILKRMKRRHGRDDAIRFCTRIRAARPEVAFGADFIAGFPTETDAMFANTLALVEECGLSYLHVFPYSARKGTPAARMPQVPKQARMERARRLREAGAASLDRHLARRVGSEARVLVENARFGRDADYAPVRLDGDAPVGAIATARVARVEGGELHAHLTA